MIDRCYQVAYKVAYQLMRIYWKATRPNTHGALVALWCEDRVLLVKNSYVRYYSLPGGYVRAGETSSAAATRELAEELGLAVEAERLRLALDVTRDWEGKRDRVELFEAEYGDAPRLKVDNREVVAAQWLRVEEALRLDLFPTLREYLLGRRAQPMAARSG